MQPRCVQEYNKLQNDIEESKRQINVAIINISYIGKDAVDREVSWLLRPLNMWCSHYAGGSADSYWDEDWKSFPNTINDLVQSIEAFIQSCDAAIQAVSDCRAKITNIHDTRLLKEEQKTVELGDEIKQDISSNNQQIAALQGLVNVLQGQQSQIQASLQQAEADLEQAQRDAEAANIGRIFAYVVCWPVGAAMDIFQVVRSLEAVVAADKCRVADLQEQIKTLQDSVAALRQREQNDEHMNDDYIKTQMGLPALHKACQLADAYGKNTITAMIEVGKLSRKAKENAYHAQNLAKNATDSTKLPINTRLQTVMELYDALIIVPSSASSIFYQLRFLNRHEGNVVRKIKSSTYPDGVWDGVMNRAGAILGYPPITPQTQQKDIPEPRVP
ncbi:MAG: hypothetical protein Q9209_007796 [Squamulea sp. 1 TL-2023]